MLQEIISRPFVGSHFSRSFCRRKTPEDPCGGPCRTRPGPHSLARKIVVQSVGFVDAARGCERRSRRISAWTICLPGTYHITVSAAGFAPGARRCFRRGEFGARSHGHAEAGGSGGNRFGTGAEFVHHDAADRSGQRGASGSGQQPGFADASAGGAQLRQHRVSGAGNRTGGAFRSDQGAHHRGFDRRQFRAEQRSVGGRRRQLRRLDWRVSAELFAGCDSGIRGAHGERRRRHGRDHGGIGRDHDQARDERMAWQRSVLRAGGGAECALSD